MVPYKIAVPSYANFAFMVILVSVFTLLWFKKDTGYNWQSLLIPYGRMSLTNYISQSIMGVTIYYGFGLSMYKYSPFIFVMVPIFVPLYVTLAPISGSPFSSVTLPLIMFF